MSPPGGPKGEYRSAQSLGRACFQMQHHHHPERAVVIILADESYNELVIEVEDPDTFVANLQQSIRR